MKTAAIGSNTEISSPDSSPTQSSIQIHDKIDRYYILSQLGAGGMGKVFAALDTELSRKVAIKVLHLPVGPENSAISATVHTRAGSLLLREARALAQLNHESVVPVYEVGRHNNAVYIVMEHLSGATLRDWQTEHRNAQWIEKAKILHIVGQGLVAAHSSGFVHQDIKPDNIMVCHDGRVCLLDFGLVRPTDLAELPNRAQTAGRKIGVRNRDNHRSEQITANTSSAPTVTRTSRGIAGGTPLYMSPEQHLKQPATTRSDQFSFALTLAEQLMGKHPYRPYARVLNIKKALEKIASNIYQCREIPDDLREILLRGLAFEPSERFSSMREFLSALESQIEHHERRWRRRSLGAVSAFLVCGGLGLGTVQARASTRCIAPIDGSSGFWSPVVAEQLERKLQSAGDTNPTHVLQLVHNSLTQWEDSWSKATQENCEASFASELRDTTQIDRVTQCLESQVNQVKSYLQLIQSSDTITPNTIIRVFSSLPDPKYCNRTRGVNSSGWSETEDPQNTKIVDAINHVSAARIFGNMSDAAKTCDEQFPDPQNVSPTYNSVYLALECTMVYHGVNQLNKSLQVNQGALLGAIELDEPYHAARAAAMIACTNFYLLHNFNPTNFELIQYALAARRRAPTVSDREYGVLSEILGVALISAGHNDQAIRHFKDTLFAYTSGLDSNEYHVYIAENNLGRAYLTTPGKRALSRKHLLRALSISRSIAGETRSSELLVLGNLMALARMTGDIELALHIMSQSKFDASSAYANIYSIEFYARSILSYLHYRGDSLASEKFIQTAQDWIKTHDVHFPRVDSHALTEWKAHLSFDRGDFSKASLLYESILSAYRDQYGDVPIELIVAQQVSQQCAGETGRITVPNYDIKIENTDLLSDGWETAAQRASLFLAQDENQAAHEQLQIFTDFFARATTNHTLEFGLANAASGWAQVAAFLGEWELADRYLAFTRMEFERNLDKLDVQWLKFYNAAITVELYRNDATKAREIAELAEALLQNRGAAVIPTQLPQTNPIPFCFRVSRKPSGRAL